MIDQELEKWIEECVQRNNERLLAEKQKQDRELAELQLAAKFAGHQSFEQVKASVPEVLWRYRLDTEFYQATFCPSWDHDRKINSLMNWRVGSFLFRVCDSYPFIKVCFSGDKVECISVFNNRYSDDFNDWDSAIARMVELKSNEQQGDDDLPF